MCLFSRELDCGMEKPLLFAVECGRSKRHGPRSSGGSATFYITFIPTRLWRSQNNHFSALGRYIDEKLPIEPIGLPSGHSGNRGSIVYNPNVRGSPFPPYRYRCDGLFI